MTDSPAVVLIDFQGKEITVNDGENLLVSASGVILVGKDGATARFIKVNSEGAPIIVGSGTPGAPAGGVLTVQGVDSGKPLSIIPSALTTFQTNQGSIGTTAVQIISSALSGRKIVNIKSLKGNSDNVYIGSSSSVSVTNGYELQPGDQMQLNLDGANAIWAVSDIGSNRICWMEIA